MKKSFAPALAACAIALTCLAPTALAAAPGAQAYTGTPAGQVADTDEDGGQEAAEDAEADPYAGLTMADIVAASDEADDDACTACHTNEAASAEDEGCIASVHASFVACTVCHDDSETLEEVHADVTAESKMPKRLKKTEVSRDLCLVCHQDDYAAGVVETALVDKNGLEVDPHDVPVSAKHETVLDCVTCHKVHADDDALERAANQCENCHHAGVYECNTCHQTE